MRFALLFLWLALLPALSLGADFSLCQPGHFARLTQRYFPSPANRVQSSPVASALKKAADNQFAVQVVKGRGIPEKWLEWKELGATERALLESLPKLTPAERAELIPLVRSIHPDLPHAKNFRKLVLLGLYDRVAWGGLTTAITEGNLHSHLALSYLPTLSNSMPAELRKEFLEALGDRYHMFGKDKSFRYADHAPKRMGDLYFKHLLRGDELIRGELASGRTPREAFRAYIAKVQQYIPGDDYYSADQALAMMERVRQSLRKKMMGRPTQSTDEEPVLWVGGSLPNGRATVIDSDIDIGTNLELAPHVQSEIEQNVKNYVSAGRPDTGIEAVFKKGLEGNFWTKVHPVAFRIRAGGIDMAVTNPSGEMEFYPIQ